MLTVLFVVTMGLYTAYKYQIMEHYNDTNVMISVDENFFDQDYTMEARKGNFQVAFAFVSYGQELEEDFSAYGKISAKLKRWNENETTHFEDLPTRPCTEAELGLS